MDLGYLRLEGLVAQAPGARRSATAGASHVLGAILAPAPVSNLADRPGPELLLVGVDVLADQRDGRSHSAAIDKPTRSLGSRWLFSQLPDLFVQLLDPLCLVSSGAGPGALVDLGLLDPGAQSLGMDTQLLADPTDRALGPRRVSQRLQRPSS